MKNPGLTLILTLALAAAAFNTSAETRIKADPEVEKPCIEAALAERLESQLAPLLKQIDQLLRDLVDDKQTATAPSAMYVLGRSMTILERSRNREWTPDASCATEIDRLNRNAQIAVRTFAALLKGDRELDIEKLTNKAARDTLPQLLVQAQALEKTVELITDSFEQREY